MGNVLKYQNPSSPLLIPSDTTNVNYLKFKETLPDNLRFTPEKDYHMYEYWRLNGQPENFDQGKNTMFWWDRSDKGWHAGSIAEDPETGIYHFMKPKHHSTVGYELDWFNKGLRTLEGGRQVPVRGKHKKFWEDFTSKYQLDTTDVDYKYIPIQKKGGSIHIKKKNRGKFTDYCGGKVTQECIERGKKSSNPKIRKRATFAANARKWKHANGGIIKAQEGTGNLLTPHPLSPVGIALNQAKAMTKTKGEQKTFVSGHEVIGPDGKKVFIRAEQPLQPLEQSIAEWLPGTGDVAEIGQITNDVKNGNLGGAILGAGLMFLPGNAGKLFRKTDVPIEIIDDVSHGIQQVAKETKSRYPWTKTDILNVRKHYALGDNISDDEIINALSDRYDKISGKIFDHNDFTELSSEIKDKILGLKQIGKASESTVYDGGDIVYKITHPVNEENIGAIRAWHQGKNTLGDIGMPTTLVGKYTTDRGTSLVFSQEKVRTPFSFWGQLSQPFIDFKLRRRGVRKKNGIYTTKEGVTFRDAKSDNVGINKNGDIVVFDPYAVSPRTGGVGYGKSILADDFSKPIDWMDKSPFKKQGGKL